MPNTWTPIFSMRLSAEDRSRIEKGAELAGVDVSTFIRNSALAAAAEISGGSAESTGYQPRGGDRRSSSARIQRKAS